MTGPEDWPESPKSLDGEYRPSRECSHWRKPWADQGKTLSTRATQNGTRNTNVLPVRRGEPTGWGDDDAAARGGGSRGAVRRRPRAARREPRPSSRACRHRPHRAQRRRQDHLLQRHHRPAGHQRRAHRLRRGGRDRDQAAQAGPPRASPAPSSASRSSAPCPSARTCWPRPRSAGVGPDDRSDASTVADRSLSEVGLAHLAGSRPTPCPPARPGCSSWPAAWPPGPASCCSTSPPRARRQRERRAGRAAGPAGGRRHGRLLVEHDMGLVMRVCRRIDVLDFGAVL